jgi:hypothetical protein
LSAKSFILPSVVNISSVGAFSDCWDAEIIYLPSCIALGTSVLDNTNFQNIIGKTITLTVPAALMTCNAGAPDGDIAYLQANNTVTVITV